MVGILIQSTSNSFRNMWEGGGDDDTRWNASIMKHIHLLTIHML